jgi:hypothetical protein
MTSLVAYTTSFAFDFSAKFVVVNSVSEPKERTQNEAVWKRGVEENIST